MLHQGRAAAIAGTDYHIPGLHMRMLGIISELVTVIIPNLEKVG